MRVSLRLVHLIVLATVAILALAVVVGVWKHANSTLVLVGGGVLPAILAAMFVTYSQLAVTEERKLRVSEVRFRKIVSWKRLRILPLDGMQKRLST